MDLGSHLPLEFLEDMLVKQRTLCHWTWQTPPRRFMITYLFKKYCLYMEMQAKTPMSPGN